jgi:hypothetical protein
MDHDQLAIEYDSFYYWLSIVVQMYDSALVVDCLTNMESCKVTLLRLFHIQRHDDSSQTNTGQSSQVLFQQVNKAQNEDDADKPKNF